MVATFFDLIASQKDFLPPTAVAEKITEKGRLRLNEQMVAYARSSADKMSGASDTLITSLLQIAGSILRDDIRAHMRSAKNTIELNVAGPLARAISALIKSPHFQLNVMDDDFFGAKALLNARGQKYQLIQSADATTVNSASENAAN